MSDCVNPDRRRQCAARGRVEMKSVNKMREKQKEFLFCQLFSKTHSSS